jgi:hypothetical protein
MKTSLFKKLHFDYYYFKQITYKISFNYLQLISSNLNRIFIYIKIMISAN